MVTLCRYVPARTSALLNWRMTLPFLSVLRNAGAATADGSIDLPHRPVLTVLYPFGEISAVGLLESAPCGPGEGCCQEPAPEAESREISATCPGDASEDSICRLHPRHRRQAARSRRHEPISPEGVRAAEVARREPAARAVEDRADRARLAGSVRLRCQPGEGRQQDPPGDRTGGRRADRPHGARLRVCLRGRARRSGTAPNRVRGRPGRLLAGLRHGASSPSWTASTSWDAKPNASIRLDSPKVSRQHAKARRHVACAPRCSISAARTARSCAGFRVTGPTTLQPGDDLRIGPFALVFRVGDYAVSTESEWR